VTHSQKDCQLEAPERCWMVVVMRTERNAPEGTVYGRDRNPCLNPM
jgi:hypothetical protein